MTQPAGASALHLPELLASLSLAMDLGLGLPLEHVARSTLMAQRVADGVGLSEAERDATYFVGLLAWLGCTADSYEMSQNFGDDQQFRHDTYGADLTGLSAVAFLLRHAGSGRSAFDRLRVGAAVIATGGRAMLNTIVAHCQATGVFASRLSLGPSVVEPLSHNFARWDGKGFPPDIRGDGIAAPMRIVQITDQFAALERLRGFDAALEAVTSQRGKAFDPDLVDEFCELAPGLVEDLDHETNLETLVARAPDSSPVLRGGEIDEALRAVGDFVDLKSPYFAGHSRGVGDLAAAAAEGSGCPPDEVRLVRRAGYLHDLGRVGVTNLVWDKPGPLSEAEMERARLHAYFTDRVLSRPAFEPLRLLAAAHHERLDGSGYHRGVGDAHLDPLAQVLAAADVYHAMVEPRPHRDARPPDQAADELKSEAAAGRLGGDAVACVLEAAGHRRPRAGKRSSGPAGLTSRQVEVLVLLARGHSNKEIAAALHISKKTVGTHIENIYAKIGVSTRPGATLFAVQHDLLDPLAPTDGAGG